MWATSEPIYRTATQAPSKAWRARHGRYRLQGTLCESCDLGFFPGRRVCPQCHRRDLAVREFARRGAVVCAANDETPLAGHGGRSERPFAIIQLEGGPAVLAELVDVDFSDVHPGLEVEMVVRKWRRESNGLYQYGYKFRPRRV